MGRAQTRVNAFGRKRHDWRPRIGETVWIHWTVRPRVPLHQGTVLNVLAPDWVLVEVVRGRKRPRKHKVPLQLYEVAPLRGRQKKEVSHA